MKYLQQSRITENPVIYLFFLMIIKKLLFRKLVTNSDCTDPAKEKCRRLLTFSFSVQFLYQCGLNSNNNISPQTTFSTFKY